MAKFSLYGISWTERERGWEQRPDGYSFHASKEHSEEYVKDYWSKQPKQVPDEYSAPGGPGKLMQVSKSLYNEKWKY